MRIATMIISGLLGILMTIQVLALIALNDVSSGLGSTEAQAQEGPIAAGLLVVILWIVGVAFVYAFPKFSMVAFILAGLLGFMIASDSQYEDMIVWGVVSLILALMSYLGAREKRKKDAERRQQIEAMNFFYQNQQRQA